MHGQGYVTVSVFLDTALAQSVTLEFHQSSIGECKMESNT